MMGKRKGAIPSGNVENSDEFTHNPVHPAPEGSGQSRKGNQKFVCGY